jgi:SAM-dependent methyltransferase
MKMCRSFMRLTSFRFKSWLVGNADRAYHLQRMMEIPTRSASHLRRLFLVAFLLAAVLPAGVATQSNSGPKAVYIPFSDAKPVVTALAEILPANLNGKSETEIASLWPRWVADHDAEIRARLAQGDEDSIVNFLLFGTSFTKQPRVTLNELQRLNAAQSDPANDTIIAARIGDLVTVAAMPGGNDRLIFARKVLIGKGINLRTLKGKADAAKFLATSLRRVMSENSGYARTIEAARLQGDATEEFAERSTLFRARGLSSDTSLLPNYAIEESLKEMKSRGLLEPSSVQRVAIIGPGLDFTDKQEGYDFYPQQTIQPFAVIDSLLRLGLGPARDVQVVTFDLSERVNGHLMQARMRAQRGQSYFVQLPRDETAGWNSGAVSYWERFGDQIGKPASPLATPAVAGTLKSRAVRIPPSIIQKIAPVDTNIVAQRLELAPAEKFDLVIATNILVYYDNFEQSLAMLNIERMLKPGGFLLSNNALLELPFFRIHSVGYSAVAYSARRDDGDHIVWYRLSP